MEKSGAAPSQAGQFLADDPLPTSGPRTLLRAEYRGPPLQTTHTGADVSLGPACPEPGQQERRDRQKVDSLGSGVRSKPALAWP